MPDGSHDGAPPPARKVQRRTERTTGKLLAAAIDILIEEGWARLTTIRVSERSGVSRGAQQHHYPTRSALVAAAIPWLMERRAEELIPRAEAAAGAEHRAEVAIDLLWQEFSGELFEAATELWVAARTDPELRESLREIERRFTTEVFAVCRELFGSALSQRADFDDRLQLAINTMRGIALLRFLQFDGRAPQRQWAYARSHLIALFD
jgi:AcrR family transcriptional regulator